MGDIVRGVELINHARGVLKGRGGAALPHRETLSFMSNLFVALQLLKDRKNLSLDSAKWANLFKHCDNIWRPTLRYM